jgi:ATP-binding cassette subfamily C protein
MDHISRKTIADGRSLDLPLDQEAEDSKLTDACISAINEAVENLRQLSGAEQAAKTISSPTQIIPPQSLPQPHAKIEQAEQLRDVPPEKPAPQQDRQPVSPPEPHAKIDNTDLPFVKTIDNNEGPIRENERRPVTGGGGKEPTDNGGGGGGGGGGGSQSGFHKRSEPINFAASLAKGIAAVRRNMVVVMLFTVAINVLLLAIPLYLFQISDRVLTSRSMDTLVMLTVAVLGAVLLQAFMDAIRRFILMRTAVELEVQLGAPILSAAARASLHGSGKDYQILQDLQQLRSFITSGTLIAFLDAPLMPLFIVVVYLVHPHLGIIIKVCCVVLFIIACLNQRFTA